MKNPAQKWSGRSASALSKCPSAWGRLALHRSGASALRLLITPQGEGHGLAAYDAEGTPILSAASAKRQPVELEGLRSAAQRRCSSASDTAFTAR